MIAMIPPMLPVSLLLNRYTLIGAAFLLYSGWVFTQGRHYEQGRQASAIVAINAKLKAVNERETGVAMAEDALRERARGEATAVLAASAPCTVTAAEAQALTRIR